jgi:hypothetical protein
MGHYASEGDPGWSKSIDRSDRARRMKQNLGYRSLAEFNAEDLPHLVGLFGMTSENKTESAVRYFAKRYWGEV